jgi:hypothetical protein
MSTLGWATRSWFLDASIVAADALEPGISNSSEGRPNGHGRHRASGRTNLEQTEIQARRHSRRVGMAAGDGVARNDRRTGLAPIGEER